MLETRLTHADVERHTRSGAWPGVTLGQIVGAHAADSPDRAAIVDDRGAYSYGELIRLADRVARGLLSAGVRAGDVVGVQLPNRREFAPLILGIERIGAVVNPLTTILRQHELLQMLGRGQATALVVAASHRGFDHAAMALELATRLPSLRTVVAVGGAVPVGVLSWDELVGERAEEVPHDVLRYLRVLGVDIAELAFTSGTTGEPKGVMHTHNSALCAVQSTITRHAFGPDDVFVVSNPVGHNAGYFYGMRLGLQSGGRVVLQENWDPDGWVGLVREHRATYSAGATTHMIDILGSAKATGEALASLRMYICSGADVPRSLASEAVRLMPQAFTRVFGMTEIGQVTSTERGDPERLLIETDGSPQPEISLRIVDDEGLPLPASIEGHVQVAGPFVFAGYIQGREFSDHWFTGDWFHTEDLGRIDEAGYLTITGRAKDIIVRGGEKVPVREIEELLRMHPRVAEVALVPVPDDRLGERAVACVRLRWGDRLELAEVTKLLESEKVTRQFWPESVLVLKEFPRTPAGKIQKSILRERLAAGASLGSGDR